MRAALLFGQDDVRIEDVPTPTPGPDEVLIRVRHNGICGSDLHLVSAPRQRTEPIGLGHEFSGVVDWAGDEVSRLTAGSRVCVRPAIECGTCHYCVAGLSHLCETLRFVGAGTALGGLAEWIAVPASMVIPLPSSVSLEAGALVEPMSVAYHAVTSTGIDPGETALILGAGPIGVGVYLALRSLDIDDVVVAETSSTRRESIAWLGADVLDPATTDVPSEIKRRTGGVGATAVFECAGVPQAFDAAVASTRGQGTICIVAIHERPLQLDVRRLVFGEKRIIGALGYRPGVFERVIELMADGAYPIDGWVEHIPLDAFEEEGLRALRNGTKVKVLVDL